MNDIKLKPCPFCSGKALSKIRIMREDPQIGIRITREDPQIGVDYAQLQIYCSKCNISKVKSIDSNRTLDNLQTVMSQLIDSWNTRSIIISE